MKIRVLRSAELDLDHGFSFYEKRESGVGAYFTQSLSKDIDGLVIYAGIHRDRNGIFRFYGHKFPYCIYYRIHNDVAYVVAVLDARQDPSKIMVREDKERRRKLP